MTLYELAQRFVGEIHEIRGPDASPFIAWCHESCDVETSDEIPWCSSFMNRLAWLLRQPRSKSAAARSWLHVGVPIDLREANAANDVVILKRGSGTQPGPDVINAPGHVTVFAGLDADGVHFYGLGGNQDDGVTVARFPRANILGVRRLA
jgi:uncharacterized protein (TIGR02594 family)